MSPDHGINIKLNEPIVLTDRQKWICQHLDTLNQIQQFCPNASPSELFRGALFALKSEGASLNPDRIAQSAHSLREIMYGVGFTKKPKNKWWQVVIEFFKKDGGGTRRERIENIFKVYQEEKRAAELAKILNDLHLIFTNIAHHTHDSSKHNDLKKKISGLGLSVSTSGPLITEALLLQLIDLLENVWKVSIPQQLTIHKRIEDFLALDLTKAEKSILSVLLAFNADAKQYFYSIADEKWLDWLWTNGFLDLLKEAPETSDNYGYRTPEISYLVKVAAKAPEKVSEIIVDDALSTTTDKFRPELIDQILRICEVLPQPQLAQVVPKIHKQEWTKLMEKYNRWGFEYEKIFEVLVASKDYKTLLLLAESVLAIRSKEEAGKKENSYGSTNPFYFNELSYTKVFGFLAGVPEEVLEETVALVSQIIYKIVLLGGNAEEGEVFPIHDSFYLFDVDFFSLELDSKKPLSYRDDVRELMAVIKTLVDRLIGANCSDPTSVRSYYEKYVQSLPESRAMWRFRLYVLSLCPEVFAPELRSAYFRLFEVEKYHDIMSDTEYEKALEKGFHTLSSDDKELYVTNVLEYFLRKEKENPDQNWHIRHGSELLTVVQSHLSETQKERASGAGFTFISDYEPMPSVGQVTSGMVHTRGPISQDEYDALTLTDIAQKLRSEWAPKQLRETYKNDDFLNPRNAEGAGDLIRNGASKRLQDYVNNAQLFFERDILDGHYTYSYFRGIEEAIKSDHSFAQSIDWTPLITTCLAIAKSGVDDSFKIGRRERESGDAWLAGWDSIHSAIGDVMQMLLKEENGALPVDFATHRDSLLSIISYLLTYQDPLPADEELETATSKTSSGGEPQQVTDPFTMAINSARGRAFQAFVYFLYPDGKRFDKDADMRIADDVKGVYERILDTEDTRAIMFMFGHYLPQFYFRDTAWIQTQLPKIFPSAEEKYHLYLAAWEGFLANNLYREMFTDPFLAELYLRGVGDTSIEKNRRYFREPDEGIATHIALAFIHYDDARFEHPLFKQFWEKGTLDQRKEFISFIGRSVVSGDNAQINEYIKKNPPVKELLKTFWEWVLETQTEPALFEEFGFWANLKKELFDPAWLAERIRKTLEKTNGVFDWDYGLSQISVELSLRAPEDMLKITKLFFVDGGIKAGHQRRPYYVDREWFDVFKNLLNNPATKAGTIDLIDELVREGGSPFWGLKKLIEQS